MKLCPRQDASKEQEGDKRVRGLDTICLRPFTYSWPSRGRGGGGGEGREGESWWRLTVRPLRADRRLILMKRILPACMVYVIISKPPSGIRLLLLLCVHCRPHLVYTLPDEVCCPVEFLPASVQLFLQRGVPRPCGVPLIASNSLHSRRTCWANNNGKTNDT